MQIYLKYLYTFLYIKHWKVWNILVSLNNKSVTIGWSSELSVLANTVNQIIKRNCHSVTSWENIPALVFKESKFLFIDYVFAIR